ncbi:MAG: TolC family protein [Planctomycetota bacterium]
MSPDRSTRMLLRGALTASAGCLLLATGCASLDPAEDLATASSLVEGRAGVDTGWTAPWDEASEAWDGRGPLSSTTAVRVALQNNRAIRRDVETIVAARADYVQAHLLPNPVLNVAIGFPTDGLGGSPLLASLVQQFTWLWMRPAAIDAAEAELRERVLAVSDAALRLAADVRTAHAAVVIAEDAVALQSDNLALLDRSAELSRLLRDAGEATAFEVNRFELDLEHARIEMTDRRSTLDEAKRTLLELLARADAPASWTTDGRVPVVPARLAELDEGDIIELASTQRLDVAAAEAVVVAELARLDSAELGRAPDVAVGIGYQQNFSDRPGVFPSVSITPKLFDDNSARIAKAGSMLEQASIGADAVRQQAIAEARTAWIDLHASYSVVAAYEASIIDLAGTNVELARLGYDAGETELTAVLDAQHQLNATRLRLADRRLAAISQLIELERAVGGSLDVQPSLALADDQLAEEATP